MTNPDKGLMDVTKLFEIGYFHIKLSNFRAWKKFVNRRKSNSHVDVNSLKSAFVLFWSVTELQTKKQATFGENSPLLILPFTYYSFQIEFVPLLERKPPKMSCKGKTIKWATKTGYKEKGKGKRKRARKKIKIDSQKKCATNKTAPLLDTISRKLCP